MKSAFQQIILSKDQREAVKDKLIQEVQKKPLWSGLILGFLACLLLTGLISLFSGGSGDGFANAKKILREDYLRMSVSEYAFTKNQARAIWRYKQFEGNGSAYLSLLKKDPLTDPLALLEYSRVVGDYSLSAPTPAAEQPAAQAGRGSFGVRLLLWILGLLIIAAVIALLLLSERGRSVYEKIHAQVNRLLRKELPSGERSSSAYSGAEPMLRRHPVPQPADKEFTAVAPQPAVGAEPDKSRGGSADNELKYESVSADWFEEQKSEAAESDIEDFTQLDHDMNQTDTPFWSKRTEPEEEFDPDIPDAEAEDALPEDDLTDILEPGEFSEDRSEDDFALTMDSLKAEQEVAEEDEELEAALEVDETLDAETLDAIDAGRGFSAAELDGTAFAGKPLNEDDEEAEEETVNADDPLIHYQATYKLGDDFFDETFSLDDREEKFIGECGIGIAETINNTDPKAVTAFEIWLFDRDDVSTPTHFLLSDFAYTNEVMLDRLKNKGKYDRIEVNKPYEVHSETLKMIVIVTELEYGTGSGGKRSYFNKVVFDVRVWQNS